MFDLPSRTAVRILATILASIGLTGYVCLPNAASTEPSAVEVDAGLPANDPIGRFITGTWRAVAPAFPEFQMLMNIDGGGTLLWSNNLEHSRLDGAVFGSWKQTGFREITSKELGFLYNSDGEHTFTGRVTHVYTFAARLQTFTSQGLEEIFAASQDPTDPTEDPVLSFNFELTGSRLNVRD